MHRELGPGFLAGVYKEAMEIELASRGIPAPGHRRIYVSDTRSKQSKRDFYADLVWYEGKVIVELKAALDRLDPASTRRRSINYLKATGIEAGSS